MCVSVRECADGLSLELKGLIDVEVAITVVDHRGLCAG